MHVGHIIVQSDSNYKIDGKYFQPTDWTKLMLQNIIQFIKLKNEAKKRFGRDFTTFLDTMELEKADEIKKVLLDLFYTC